jgi:hypothetical protein
MNSISFAGSVSRYSASFSPIRKRSEIYAVKVFDAATPTSSPVRV